MTKKQRKAAKEQIRADIIPNIDNDRKAQITANKIAFIYNTLTRKIFLTNICIAGITLLLFGASVFTLKSANKSADAAIKSVKETQRIFEIENAPILQVGAVGISNWWRKDNFSIITFQIYNWSPRPVEVEWAVFGVRYDTSNSRSEIIENTDSIFGYDNPSGYIAPKFAYEPKFDRRIKNTDKTINALENGMNTFWGVVCYDNYITDKRNYYVFSVRIVKVYPKEQSWHSIDSIFINDYTDTLKSQYNKCSTYVRDNR